MIIGKHAGINNSILCEYYWNGTDEPIYLHVKNHEYHNIYNIELMILEVINDRVYAMTRDLAIMLYDSRIPGDEVNIVSRIHKFHNEDELIVKYIYKRSKKIFYDANGVHLVYTYPGDRIMLDLTTVTCIRDDSIKRYSMYEYKEFSDHNYSDTITYESWNVIINDYNKRIVRLSRAGKPQIKINVREDIDFVLGIIDGHVIISNYEDNRGISYDAIPIHNPDNRRVITDTITKMQFQYIQGYFIYVLSIDFDNGIGTYIMRVIDFRSRFMYEFTHEHKCEL